MKGVDPISATITEGTPTTGAWPVAIQLTDIAGNDIQACRGVFAYISKNSDGSTISADGTDTTEFVIGTDGLFVETLADVAGMLISESDGDIDVVITVASDKTAYLVLVMPDGRLVISDALTNPSG